MGMPADLMVVEILIVIGKIKNPEKLKERLRSKIGLNDAQIAFVTEHQKDEEIEDADGFKRKLLSLQPERAYHKLEDDYRFVRKGMVSNVVVTLLFILLTAAVVYLG